MTQQLDIRSQHTCFGGTQSFYQHESTIIGLPMRFSIYLPPQAQQETVPAVFFLAGLTCTEETFMIKAGAQLYAAQYGLMLISMDTSPRNTGIAGDTDDWDFGAGAGFYLDAIEQPWSGHYLMESYITQELYNIVIEQFPVDKLKIGISGHSMGGHGALTLALRHPNHFQSVSAFAPIAAPMHCPWGQKAFRFYLGEDKSHWRGHDATALIEDGHRTAGNILVDQGLNDQFLAEQLHPKRLEETCDQANQQLTLRYHPGYDHGYYFISTFIGDHLKHHQDELNNTL